MSEWGKPGPQHIPGPNPFVSASSEGTMSPEPMDVDQAIDVLRERERDPRALEALSVLAREHERLRDQLKFCPYCAGAFVPESKGYEGPCAGCKRAEQAERERDAARADVRDIEEKLCELVRQRDQLGLIVTETLSVPLDQADSPYDVPRVKGDTA